ncbi:MAG: hypothetical protein O6952_05640, partial [Planctomycetota bacterium]|nr:hypothetical protein [Planctomycetota bacterium]
GVLGFSQIRTVYITPEITRFRPLAVIPQIPFLIRLVLVGTASGGLFASDTMGVKWKDVSAGLPDLDLRAIDTALQVITDPQEPTRTTLNYIMFAGTGAGGMARGTTDINILSDPLDPSMFKTQILGVVWSAVNTGLPQGGTGLAVNAVAIDPNFTSNVFIGTEFDGVFMTGSGGSLWSALDPGSPLTSPVGDNLTNPRVDDIGLVFNTCADCTTILAGTAGGGANRIEILKQ